MRNQKSITVTIVHLALAVALISSNDQASNAGQTPVGPSDAASVQAAMPITSSDFGEPQVWGAATNVVSVKHLYLSAQPDLAALLTAVEQDVGVVINLREPDEQEWDEKAAATSLGLTYYNLPIPRSGSGFDSDDLAQISKLVGKHRDTKILMHCSSGNRAGAWFAVHLVRDHGMSAKQSIELSRHVGLTNEVMKSRVIEFLLTDREKSHDS